MTRRHARGRPDPGARRRGHRSRTASGRSRRRPIRRSGSRSSSSRTTARTTPRASRGLPAPRCSSATSRTCAGKGQALRWAIERAARPRRAAGRSGRGRRRLDRRSEPPRGSRRAGFEEGAEAVQGESLLVGDGSPEQALRAAAFLLVNRDEADGPLRPRARGRARRATGCCSAAGLLTDHPWSAFSSTEDVEYGLALRAAGRQAGVRARGDRLVAGRAARPGRRDPAAPLGGREAPPRPDAEPPAPRAGVPRAAPGAARCRRRARGPAARLPRGRRRLGHRRRARRSPGWTGLRRGP